MGWDTSVVMHIGAKDYVLVLLCLLCLASNIACDVYGWPLSLKGAAKR